MKVKMSLALTLQTFFSIFIMIVLMGDMSLKVSQIILVMVFLECVLVSMQSRLFNIYQLFLGMMFFFGLAIPVFNIIGLYEYPSGFMFMYDSSVRVRLDEAIMAETYKVYCVVLLGTSVGWLMWSKKKEYYKQEYFNTNFQFSKKHHQLIGVIKKCFCVIWPLELIYQIIYLQTSIIFGYVATVHLKTNLGIAIQMLSGIDLVYPFFGYYILYNCRCKNKFKKIATVFCIPYVIQMFTGQRGIAMSMILALIFLYSWYFNQIKVRQIVTVFCGFMIFIMGIGSYRFTRNTNDFFTTFTSELSANIISTFTESSSSLIVTSYTIYYLDEFYNKCPFLFGYIAAIFSFADNYTVEGILYKSYLAQHVTYLINPSKLLGGSTIGTSILAEFYELTAGIFSLIFLLSLLMFYLAGWFIKNLYRNEMYFYFGMSYIQNLLLSPRGSVMKIFSKISVIYLLIFMIIYILDKKRYKCEMKKCEKNNQKDMF